MPCELTDWRIDGAEVRRVGGAPIKWLNGADWRMPADATRQSG